MEIIKETSGPEMCCMVVHYIIIVLAKYLQMMVAYHIHRKQPESVANDFKRFNQSYEKLLSDFNAPLAICMVQTYFFAILQTLVF